MRQYWWLSTRWATALVVTVDGKIVRDGTAPIFKKWAGSYVWELADKWAADLVELESELDKVRP